MSGGSFDYLCYTQDEDLFSYEYINNLDTMIGYLVKEDYIDVAREAQELLQTIKQSKIRVETMHNRLSGVFKAVEWYKSGDWGKDSIEKAVEEYRAKEE